MASALVAGAGRGRMLADIGGTHARFAWQATSGGPLGDFVTLECGNFKSLGDAMHTVLRLWNRRPDECGIAIATPVLGDQVRMTNRGWQFSRAQLRNDFGFERLEVLNDFSALARAVPSLVAPEVRQLGGGERVPGAPIAVIGPGTGLGVSGLIPDGRAGWTVLESEGGHATLPASTAFEHAVLARMTAKHKHVSAERALSGAGLENLHAAVWSFTTAVTPVPRMDAAAITQAALEGSDPLCIEALNLFCGFLGSVAGNLALTLGARGGVYIGGGIVPRLGNFLANSPFRERFESKGRLAGYLSEIPVFVIRSRESPALKGVAYALDAATAAAR